jgi:hypothetical protein
MSIPSLWKMCEPQKFMIMGKAAHGWPTLLTMARNGQSSCCTTCDMQLEFKMTFTMGPLSCDIKSYVQML